MSSITRCLKNNHGSKGSYFSLRNFSKSNTLNASTADVVEKDVFDPTKPIKFSSSEAGWKYKKYAESIPNYPWYKPVILWGTFVFYLNYFMFFRQPNDIDEELSMPLGQRLLWIKEQHLLRERNSLKSKGSATKSVDEELENINRLRKKFNYI